jgi:hypothetical protein
VSPDIALEANNLFAPVFEAAILELWNNTWGGTYRLDNATVEIVVDFSTGSIQLARLESEGKDWLAILGSNVDEIQNREDLISYLWPGNDDLSWR